MSTQLQMHIKTVSQPSLPSVEGGLLQRKCACGQHTIAGGECEECRQKQGGMIQRAAVNAVPSIVHDVLSSSGQPLDTGTRAFMEPRFEHDFSGVRVHTDARAAESARVVNALAYTVGRDIVFETGQYAPGTTEGKRLLAHELTHVVQQGRSVSEVMPRHKSVNSLQSKLRLGSVGDSFECQAETAVDTILEGIGVPSLSRARELLVQCAPPKKRPASGPKPPPSPCVPDRPLKWEDYKGKTPSEGAATGHGAFTKTKPDKTTYQGKPMFQARLDPAASWVLPKYSHPTDRKRNGCTKYIQECENDFREDLQLSTWSFSDGPSKECPAAILPSSAVVATSRAECKTIIGKECDRAAEEESKRLLRHEQLHFNIVCVLVKKANAALNSGEDQEDIQRTLDEQSQKLSEQYDDQTQNGCDADSQAKWEKDVGADLPDITIR